MNVLRVISSLDPSSGGPVEAAKNIDRALVARGVGVQVVCLDAEGTRQYACDYPAPVHLIGPSRFSYRLNSRLISWLRRNHHRFDAVIIDGLWQYHGLAVWYVLRNTGVPYFVFPHGMLDPWFKRGNIIKHLKKWLYWPWAEYRVLRDAAAVVFTCDEERRLSRESFWLYRCREVVISLGTVAPPPPSEFLTQKFDSLFPGLSNKRVVLFLGRIHQKKGCDLLVEAFSKVAACDASLHLIVAGPDQVGWRSDLQSKAAALGISDRISWPGMLLGDDKWAAFHACDAFCLPSHQENFGIVVAEALGCGKVVLISNKVNIWREIKSDSAAIVCEDDLGGVVSALKGWLSMSPTELKALSAAALKCFESRYRVENVACELIGLIESRAV